MNDDSGMSQRERRRQQHDANKSKVTLNKGDLKKWTGPAVLLLVVGGIVTAMVVTEQNAPDCPDPHWHSAYSVWIDGDRVQFPDYITPTDNAWASGTHVHADDGVYHYHAPVVKCTPMEDAFRNLDVAVSEDALVIGESRGPQAGTYDQAPIRMFYQAWGSEQDDNWQEVTDFDSVLEQQMPDGDGVVILYGEYTQEELDGILAAAPSLKGNPSYDPHSPPPGS